MKKRHEDFIVYDSWLIKHERNEFLTLSQYITKVEKGRKKSYQGLKPIGFKKMYIVTNFKNSIKPGAIIRSKKNLKNTCHV